MLQSNIEDILPFILQIYFIKHLEGLKAFLHSQQENVFFLHKMSLVTEVDQNQDKSTLVIQNIQKYICIDKMLIEIKIANTKWFLKL